MVGLNQVVLEEYSSFCQYCRLPSQEEYHKKCQATVQRWQIANFDMGKFWGEYLGNERDDFVANHRDLYNGFLPYRYHLFKFIIIDQHHHTAAFVHVKYCSENHDCSFRCFPKRGS